MRTLTLLLLTLTAAAQQPIMLDDIHYYTLDRKGTVAFFQKHFGARRMAEQPLNPMYFIDFLEVRPGQSTLNVSPPGPFPGVRVADPKRWERTLVPPAEANPPVYGVQYVALSTKDLGAALKKLTANGVRIANPSLKLPAEPMAKAAAIWGPDYNLITLVERPNDAGTSPFGLDHLQLLVSDLDANVRFFKDVYGAQEVVRTGQTVVLRVAQNDRLVLSTPEAMGLDRALVAKRDPKLFRPGIDHIGFLFADVAGPVQSAMAKGYGFVLKPTKFMLNDKPTPYTFAITMSPDGLQCELYSEDGRIKARNQYVTDSR